MCSQPCRAPRVQRDSLLVAAALSPAEKLHQWRHLTPEREREGEKSPLVEVLPRGLGVDRGQLRIEAISRSTRSSTDDERVLAQDGPLRLVVQLQVHPVDGVVVAALLGGADEVAAQLGPGGLRRHRLGPEDRRVGGHPRRQPTLLQQGEQPAAPPDVVVGQVELGDPVVGQAQPVLGRVAVQQPELDRPVDLGVHQGQLVLGDRPQRPLPQVQHPVDGPVARGSPGGRTR